MTYQPKSVDKMANLDTFCISLNSGQIRTYFYNDLVTGYFVCTLQKNSLLNCHPFSNWLYYPHLVAMRLTSHEIRVYSPHKNKETIEKSRITLWKSHNFKMFETQYVGERI